MSLMGVIWNDLFDSELFSAFDMFSKPDQTEPTPSK